MKIWIKTKIIGTGNIGDPRHADVPAELSCSLMELPNNECLCRVAGISENISLITAPKLTDEEALKIIKARHPDSSLESLDAIDLEVDKIAKLEGLDPTIRADIQIPARGTCVLQAQENYLMAHISEKMGLTKEYWDAEAGKTIKWKKGIDVENDIKDGKGEAHEFVLSRIRKRIRKNIPF